MFDIGFMELLLISIVALLVLGPEKLPQAVRTAALWFGRARRSFNKVKSEIEREINADEIRRQLHNESIMADLDEAKQRAGKLTKDTKQTFSKLEKDVRHGLDGLDGPDGPDGPDGKTEERKTGNRQGKETGTKEGKKTTPDGRKAPESRSTAAETPAPDDTEDTDSETATGRDDDPSAEQDRQQSEHSPDTDSQPEEEKPVTDFYNNPPDKVVTVQGRKFKAGRDDDDRA